MYNPDDDDRKQTGRRRWFKFFRAITILTLLGAGLGMGFIGGLFAAVSRVLPKGEALSDIRPSSPTRVLASDGSLLARVYLPDQNRELVHLSQMGQVVNATLAIEDIRFYSHPGIDPHGILRALVKNAVAGDSKEGASTITQQLARNLYLTREKKITRKLQEILLALELERRYSKEEILETYLNQVFYGANTSGLQSWGVQMAAHNYFGKSAKSLTLAEAAMLAGLPKNPRDYNPYRHRKEALERRKVVLVNMRDNHFITLAQYKHAVAEPLKLAQEKDLPAMADYHAPYFVRHILTTEIKRIFGQDWEKLTYHYGIDIYTSLDPRMQKVAEEAVTNSVDKNRFRKIDDGALIAIDPKTGLIKAMVGGTNFTNDQYNIVTQGHRQPGSAFKPFDYTTALLRGYTPDTTVFDRPGHYPSGSGKPWTPKNSDGGYHGPMPLKKALWLSRNAAAAGVAYDVGIRDIITVAHRMGIRYPLTPMLSTSLGASVVVPMEICSAYGTLANQGVHHPPTGVTRVTTADGDVLYEYRPQPQRAIPIAIANTMKETMRGVIERGTARAARCPFPASGKTGTTNSFRDAWFIGYTDDLVAAVWVGNRSNEPMNHTYGGTVPAPIWRVFMLVAEPIMAAEHSETADELARINDLPDNMTGLDTSPTPYIMKLNGQISTTEMRKAQQQNYAEKTAPSVATAKQGEEYLVSICLDSGDLSTQWCPNKVAVTYVKGQQPGPPTRYCTLHTGPESVPNADEDKSSGHEKQTGKKKDEGVLISICAETGKIATPNCPTVLLRRFTHDAPTETCPLHGGE